MVEKEVNVKNNFDDRFIKWFSDINNKDIPTVGGKGASLGEMFNNKFPVPPGFMITAQAFEFFINQMELRESIADIIKDIDFEKTAELQKASREIRDLIEEKEIPLDLKDEILESYHILGSEKIDTKGVSQDALNILKNAQEPIFVSVRSSATTEDLADASFAGQQESFLNIKGDMQLIEHVKKCFSSLYTARAIYYRNKKGFKEGDSLLAVVIQKMVDSEKSGVVFSRDPVNLNEDIVVEAVYGLGEGIVSGKIKPDNYISSRDLKVKDIKVADKKIAIVRNSAGSNETVKLSKERSESQVLTNGEILEIADLAIKLENHYKKPQDIEFAIESRKVYIVQSRPITTLGGKAVSNDSKPIEGKVLVEGISASPGIGVGVVKIIESMDDLDKIKKGDVLVTEMTNPDMVVSMQKSIAIVTDEGGMTSHAAIVSREMGIPAIVGVGDATTVLKEGMQITVDGSGGKVYEGAVAETMQKEIKPAVKVDKVKIKIIVDLPDFAERAAESGVEDIGLTRMEGIIASMNKHPLKYEKEDKLDDYTELLRKGIEKISKPFKSMWIRASDIRSDEYASLDGAPEKEINPMMGLHGTRFLLKHPRILQAELLAIKKVAEQYSDKKFGVMIPLIISVEELREAKKFFNEFKTENMEFGVMIETPASVQIIDDICDEGIDFISFGTNDLTQFTLAIDRGEDEVQYLYNEAHPAVLAQMAKVIQACNEKNVQSSICGQAGSRPEIAEFLFKQGIDSISVNADAAYDISNLIKKMEDEMPEEEEELEEELDEDPQLDNHIQEIEKRIENINIQQADVQIQEPQVEQRNEVDLARGERHRMGTKVSLTSHPSLNKNPRLVVCADCNKETKLPFKPRKNRDYYCKDCFSNRKRTKVPLTSQPSFDKAPLTNTPSLDDQINNLNQNQPKQENIEQNNIEQPNQDNFTPTTYTSVKDLPELPDDDKGKPATMEDIREHEERLLDETKIKYAAELQEEEIEKVQEVAKDYEENIGSINPIDNLDSVDDKAEEIHKDVEEDNKEEAQRYDDIEDNVEVSGGRVDESVGGSDNDNVGVYNPNEEDNKSNSPPSYSYNNFDDDYDWR